MEDHKQIPAAGDPVEPELLEVNLSLWESLSDAVFERHFRQRYFGDEELSRTEAIARLKDRLDAFKADAQPDTDGSSQNLDRPIPAPPTASSCLTQTGADVTFDSYFLEQVESYWPTRSFLASVSLHLAILVLISLIRFPAERNGYIDFEKEKVIYYDVSGQFPTIAPSAPQEMINRKDESTKSPEPKIPDSTNANPEVRIHPEMQKPAEMIVEQPDMTPVDSLPKMQLPNILLKSARTDPGRAPLILEQPKFATIDEPIQAHQVSVQPQVLNADSSIAQQLKLAPPAESPLAIPVIEEPKGEIQGGQLRSPNGTDLLVYSKQPVLPKGELSVPKVNSSGRMISQSKVNSPAGAEEIGKADIVIPSISIKNHTQVIPQGAGLGVIQAPLPPKPELEVKKAEERKQPSSPSLQSSLPSLLPGIQPMKLEPHLTPDETESPIKELEREGKKIYSTSMNSPNFTSKRGSWIFRFAELNEVRIINEVPHNIPNDPPAIDVPITAPSAIVKVDPKYPPEVIREKVEGRVILYAVLRIDGTIDPATVRIIQKLDPRLDVSARDALVHWKFKPSLKNGQPIAIQAEITIPFYFRDDWFKP